MKKYESLATLKRELYSNKIMKIEARIAFICDNKKQADYIKE